jgi:hypothetical protein
LVNVMILSCSYRQKENIFKSVESKNHSAVIPVMQTEEEPAQWWESRHNSINKRLKEGNVDLLFIGNSIIHGWENSGKEYWNLYYKHRNAVNMGFGWDRTQHVIWRIDHTNFENLTPKLAIVLVGINNWPNTSEEIADGIIMICKKLREKLPMMKILLLAIFPSDQTPTDNRRKMEKASLLASKIADGKMIYYLDISKEFLEQDGTISIDIMPDYIHPSNKGYKIWAEAMEPTIAKLLVEEEVMIK